MISADLPPPRKLRTFGLADRVHELAGVLNRAHAELVEIVADALSDESWAGGGIASPEHWLILHAGLSRGRAATIVALARRRAELPSTIEHFDAGRLSVEQAAVIGRRVPPAYEKSVADMAQYATVPQIQRAVGKYPFVEPPADPSEPKPPRERFGRPGREPARLTTSFDGVGGFALRYIGDADMGALIEAVLKEAKDARFRQDGQQVPLAQIFEEIMTGHLHRATQDTPSRRDLYRVLVHLDIPTTASAPTADAGQPFAQPSTGQPAGATNAQNADTLKQRAAPSGEAMTRSRSRSRSRWRSDQRPLEDGEQARDEPGLTDGGDPRRSSTSMASDSTARYARTVEDAVGGGGGDDGVVGWLNAGPRLPAYLIEALTCDAHLVPMWQRDGTPVWLGRSRRSIPPKVRALILDRDRGCRYPGCPVTGRGHVDVHHLIHWLHHGRSDPDNLLCLCSQHHRRLHAGEFSIIGNPDLPEGHPDGLRFKTAKGLPIMLAMPDPNATLTSVPRYPGPTGETLHTKWVVFRPTG